jgi:aspartate carbamoyltransferase regulatory subunit
MKKDTRKELKVSAIENGTVIDHIPSASVFQVIKMLNLKNIGTQITFGINLESKKFGKKGILKVSDKYFEIEEINKIALVAPSATLIEIKDYEVVSKKNISIPNEIMKFVKCFNPNCITNHENIITKFNVISEEGEEVKLHCTYCDKITKKENIMFI